MTEKVVGESALRLCLLDIANQDNWEIADLLYRLEGISSLAKPFKVTERGRKLASDINECIDIIKDLIEYEKKQSKRIGEMCNNPEYILVPMASSIDICNKPKTW